jgi:hypothetical protein
LSLSQSRPTCASTPIVQRKLTDHPAERIVDAHIFFHTHTPAEATGITPNVVPAEIDAYHFRPLPKFTVGFHAKLNPISQDLAFGAILAQTLNEKLFHKSKPTAAPNPVQDAS